MSIPEGHESAIYLTSNDNDLILPGVGKCIVKTSEQSIPYFNIKSENGKFHCCVRIFENCYYSENGESTDILNPEQLKVFTEWLRKKFPIQKFYGNTWQFAKYFCEHYCCEELEYKFMTDNMPDYMSMNSFKDD